MRILPSLTPETETVYKLKLTRSFRRCARKSPKKLMEILVTKIEGKQ